MTQPIDPFRDDQARNAFTPVTPAGVPGHDMQFYDSQELLAQSVARFLAEGVRAGQPLIVIARKPLWAQVGQQLRRHDVDIAHLEADGRCLYFDSRTALRAFMQGPEPDAELFRATIGDVFRKTIDGRAYIVVRAFGDMVDVLASEGNVKGAIALEDLWNDLAAHHAFSLLCAYSTASTLTTARAHDVRQICGRHQHVIQTKDSGGHSAKKEA